MIRPFLEPLIARQQRFGIDQFAIDLGPARPGRDALFRARVFLRRHPFAHGRRVFGESLAWRPQDASDRRLGVARLRFFGRSDHANLAEAWGRGWLFFADFAPTAAAARVVRIRIFLVRVRMMAAMTGSGSGSFFDPRYFIHRCIVARRLFVNHPFLQRCDRLHVFSRFFPFLLLPWFWLSSVPLAPILPFSVATVTAADTAAAAVIVLLRVFPFGSVAVMVLSCSPFAGIAVVLIAITAMMSTSGALCGYASTGGGCCSTRNQPVCGYFLSMQSFFFPRSMISIGPFMTSVMISIFSFVVSSMISIVSLVTSVMTSVMISRGSIIA